MRESRACVLVRKQRISQSECRVHRRGRHGCRKVRDLDEPRRGDNRSNRFACGGQADHLR